jgi:hypothetical protein
MKVAENAGSNAENNARSWRCLRFGEGTFRLKPASELD